MTRSRSHLFAPAAGFFVSRNGHLLTNNHVVAECTAVRVSDADKSMPAKILATDPERDVALLQLSHATPAAVFRGEERLRPGKSVVVVGFPPSGLLTSDPIVTTGIISALAGPRDDRHLLQISAPIQPRNSGGPLLDSSGHVVGVGTGLPQGTGDRGRDRSAGNAAVADRALEVTVRLECWK